MCVQYESTPGDWITDSSNCQGDSGTGGGAVEELGGSWNPSYTWRTVTAATVDGNSASAISDTW